MCLHPARGTGDVSAAIDGVHGDAVELGLSRGLCCPLLTFGEIQKLSGSHPSVLHSSVGWQDQGGTEADGRLPAEPSGSFVEKLASLMRLHPTMAFGVQGGKTIQISVSSLRLSRRAGKH